MTYVPWSEGAYTAQTVIDDPAMPTITPTGILDHRGDMLVRVQTPARVQMGVKAGASYSPGGSVVLPERMVVRR